MQTSDTDADGPRARPHIDVTISLSVSDAGDGSPHVQGVVGHATRPGGADDGDPPASSPFEGWMELLATLEGIAKRQITGR